MWHFLSVPLALSCAGGTECPKSGCVEMQTSPFHSPQGSTLPLAHVQPTVYSTEPSRKPLLTDYRASYTAEVGRGYRCRLGLRVFVCADPVHFRPVNWLFMLCYLMCLILAAPAWDPAERLSPLSSPLSLESSSFTLNLNVCLKTQQFKKEKRWSFESNMKKQK